ncbi:hypothetical protein [Entomobacter blattae]|uniref:Elongation factor Ts n=1 Tax=Entomobacter blattae TaxID=2762277 RepID=A0A7H1NTI9_9PROT|nr:Elongation factor Ts [Entomobacter blattae]
MEAWCNTPENSAAMVEVNAETDFVARNKTFQQFVQDIAHVALKAGEDVEAIFLYTLDKGWFINDSKETILKRVCFVHEYCTPYPPISYCC